MTAAWFRGAGLGIFIHWGAYAVPAWAVPAGELGVLEPDEFLRTNPYAEWYANTIRIPDSPAAAHHSSVYGNRPYESFLDDWDASEFDPDEWADLFRRAGARYVVLTTKHHDGICLWDAPGADLTTVSRGPRRDLVGELASAVRRAGLRFGCYYSGGLDWHVSDLPPIRRAADVTEIRPRDGAYAAYAEAHVRDLIARYRPDVLWNDIEWPDAGKPTLPRLFADYYSAVPEGVVNDRWGVDHWDYRTSEYQHSRDVETPDHAWEHCRGIGYSFGYNSQEGPEHSLTGEAAAALLADVSSRGGNLLLNVGPRADGTIPELQRAALEGISRRGR